jgi:asparagine synthase (glutamine-hydrolysing)
VLQKVDRATMRVSLEARAPLLDTEVVEFCLALPERCACTARPRSTSSERRTGAGCRGPSSTRPKKGFGAPVGQWLRGPLRKLLTDTLSPARLRAAGGFTPHRRALDDEHLAGRAITARLLYSLLVLEHWRRRWLEAA